MRARPHAQTLYGPRARHAPGTRPVRAWPGRCGDSLALCYTPAMDGISWALNQLRPDQPGFWLLVDCLVGCGLWVFASWVPARWQPLSVATRWAMPAYLALLAGAIAPQQMGLTGINWDTGLRVGLGFVVAILALVGFARLAARDAMPVPENEKRPDAIVFGMLFRGCEQFHWCFQRAAVLAILLAWPNAGSTISYWALWIAALLALPGVWQGGGALQRIYGGTALMTTAILFFYTRNFWLCWALHVGILLIGGLGELQMAGGRWQAAGDK